MVSSLNSTIVNLTVDFTAERCGNIIYIALYQSLFFLIGIKCLQFNNMLHVRAGEEAVLKTVGCKRLAGSNPVCSVI